MKTSIVEAVGLHNMPLLEVLEVAGFFMLQFVRIVLFYSTSMKVLGVNPGEPSTITKL